MTRLGALEARQAATCLVLLKMLKKILAPHHQLIEHPDIFCILRLTFTPPPLKKTISQHVEYTWGIVVHHKTSHTLFELSISSSAKIPPSVIRFTCMHTFLLPVCPHHPLYTNFQRIQQLSKLPLQNIPFFQEDCVGHNRS